MNRSIILAATLLSAVGISAVAPSIAVAQTLQYSQPFTQGTGYIPGDPQYDDWIDFRAALPTTGVNSITVSGSKDAVGRTCSDPVKAQQIADAMRAGTTNPFATTLSLSCGSFEWTTGSCSQTPNNDADLELSVGSSPYQNCSCARDTYTLRPGISGNTIYPNPNWGGIAGSTCYGESQVMTVTINSGVDVDIDIKPGSFPNSINLGSGGATPVAIVGDGVLNLDDIDIDTLTLGTSGVKTVGKKDKQLCSIEDVTGDFSAGPEGYPDGIDDLVCHFVTMGIVPEDGDTAAKLSGNLLDGTPIEGSDLVNIVP